MITNHALVVCCIEHFMGTTKKASKMTTDEKCTAIRCCNGTNLKQELTVIERRITKAINNNL